MDIDFDRLLAAEGLAEEKKRPSGVAVRYRPRRHFMPLHSSDKRWLFVCSHRRAGKTVAIANHLIRAAMANKRAYPKPMYAYVGPSFDQAKDLVWGYLRQYTDSIPGVRYNESELTCIFPNKARIKLYGGSQSYERMRGMYFDGIALDEFPLLNPNVFSTVVRPCLADYSGWAIVSGTSNGDDHFNALRLKTENDPRWAQFLIPLSSTGEEALSKEEALELTQDMSPEEYAREMECSFSAPVEGSYYGDMLNHLLGQKRIGKVPVDLASPVITGWDIGISDYTCIWLWQLCGREIHFIDYVQNNGKALDFYSGELQTRAHQRGYKFKCHCLPHDVEARELATGQSRRQVLMGLMNEPIITAPWGSVEDGIAAVRSILGVAWFDDVACRTGLEMLRGYRRSKMGQPVHGPGPHSHGADAMRTMATSFHMVSGLGGSMARGAGALRRRLRGVW